MTGNIRLTAVGSFFTFVTFLTSMAVACTVLAAEGDAPPSLEGLNRLAVMVVPPSPDAERNGMKGEQIKTNIEQKLRQAGIKVLADREMEKPGFSYLNVDTNVTKDKNPELLGYKVKFEVYKQVIQNPQDEIETAFQWVSVNVWSSEENGTASGSDLKNKVQKQIDDITEKFLNAYLAANPKNK